MADESTNQSSSEQPTAVPVSSPRGASTRDAVAILLAAGRSTRMKTDLPKVMHEICGRPMIAYVLDACRGAGISTFYVVVGFGKEAVIEAFAREPGVRFVEQPVQSGTGHAVSMCAEALDGFVGDVIVVAGDMPLIRSGTLRTLLESHRASGSAASIATTKLEDPTGYGRIIRDASGTFERIVEHRDCTAQQLKIDEVNPSYYCFDAPALFEALTKISPDNAKGEYYLTDVLSVLRAAGGPVLASTTVPAEDAMGINSRAELAQVSRVMQRRIQADWMDHGVTIVDPANTWIDSRAKIGEDTIIKPFTYIEGNARIGVGCRIGPFAYVADGAVVSGGNNVGPGALSAFDTTGRVRPHIRAGVKRQAPAVRRPPSQTGYA